MLKHTKSEQSVVQTDKDSEHSVTNYNPQQPEPSTASSLQTSNEINIDSSMQEQLYEESTLVWKDNHFGDPGSDENANPACNKSFADLMHGIGDDIQLAIGNVCMPNSNEDLYDIQLALELLIEQIAYTKNQ